MEQHRIQARLMELGVEIIASSRLQSISADSVTLTCVYSERTRTVDASSVVMVVSRLPDDALYLELMADPDGPRDAGIETLRRIGDCHGPATIAAAVYEGHRFARELGEEVSELPFRRELTELSQTFDLP